MVRKNAAASWAASPGRQRPGSISHVPTFVRCTIALPFICRTVHHLRAQFVALGGGRLVRKPDVAAIHEHVDGWFEPTLLTPG